MGYGKQLRIGSLKERFTFRRQRVNCVGALILSAFIVLLGHSCSFFFCSLKLLTIFSVISAPSVAKFFGCA